MPSINPFFISAERSRRKAAEYCDESYRSFLHILREANVPFPISTQELERELNESSGK